MNFGGYACTVRVDGTGQWWLDHTPFVYGLGPYPSEAVALRNRAAYLVEIGFPENYGPVDIRDVVECDVRTAALSAHRVMGEMIRLDVGNDWSDAAPWEIPFSPLPPPPSADEERRWAEIAAAERIECIFYIAHGTFFDAELCCAVSTPPDGVHDILEPTPTFAFRIDYPLTCPRLVSLTHEDGTAWSRLQMYRAITEEYQRTYHDDSVDPESPGPYGIWGHLIGDLALDYMARLPDGSWHLGVGS